MLTVRMIMEMTNRHDQLKEANEIRKQMWSWVYLDSHHLPWKQVFPGRSKEVGLHFTAKG